MFVYIHKYIGMYISGPVLCHRITTMMIPSACTQTTWIGSSVKVPNPPPTPPTLAA